MKKWIISLCMGAVLALSVGAVSTAYGRSGGAAAFCEEFEDATGLPQDVCTACFNPGSGDKAVCICKAAVDQGYIENQGECVASLNAEGIP